MALIVSMAMITPVGSVIGILCVAVAIWGAAGFGSPPPQQHLLLERAPDRGAVAVAVNASAIYLGSAIGSSLGGIALHAGVSAKTLPLMASGFAVLAAISYVALVVPNRFARSEAATTGGQDQAMPNQIGPT
jgi:predicted MFS family arabinose efflux permease